MDGIKYWIGMGAPRINRCVNGYLNPDCFRPAFRIPAFAGVSVLDVKGFQMAGTYWAIQGVSRRATAFTCSSSLRITATSAAFLALPR